MIFILLSVRHDYYKIPTSGNLLVKTMLFVI